ncbi:uncharacterized protein LOC122506054 [Leptopilina heterotoma]|uniref:uncharacterized protein LOC122506054 n=1 Tax=Leptopilina heterotoma TaxID=63436 RepID=UPI001CA83C29|nr:uncharacterized protein LOC122506054 [Leptopilina heterotoma]
MKYFIFAFLLGFVQIAFGFPQNNNHEEQNKNVISEIQFNVKKIIVDFKEFSTSVKENLQKYFDQEDKNVPEQLQTLKHDIFKEVEVEILNDVNKEENLCYIIAKTNIETILQNKTQKIRQCQFDELLFGFSPIYINMNVTLKMGYELVDNLNSVKKSCEYVEDEPICLSNTKLGVEILVNNLKNSINQMTQLANEAYNSMLSKMEECKTKEIKGLKEKFHLIKNNANGCSSII